MALGTWKEDPKENAVLQQEFNDLGGNAEGISNSQKLRIA